MHLSLPNASILRLDVVHYTHCTLEYLHPIKDIRIYNDGDWTTENGTVTIIVTIIVTMTTVTTRM